MPQRVAVPRSITGALGALISLCSTVAAQSNTGAIVGQVVDQMTRQPVAAADVILVGTTHRGATGEDGRYRLGGITAGSYQLQVRRIGYRPSVSDVAHSGAGTDTVDVALQPTVTTIDEMVVTATGEEQRKRETGNSVATIRPNEEVLATSSNISDVLTGRAAGVDVQLSGGLVGGGSRVRIRGANSVSLNNEPLLIVDGVRATSGLDNQSPNFNIGGQSPSRLNDLNPEDIESIEILKGPAAAALYGTAAANGVIQVTTKRGRAGRTRWTFHADRGVINNATDFPANFARIGTLAASGARTTACTLDSETQGLCTPTPDSLVSFSPLAAASPFVQGSAESYGLGISGGSERVTYYVSGDFDGEQGIYDVSSLRRTNLRANVRGQLRDNWDLSVSSAYLQSKIRFPKNDNLFTGHLLSGMLGSAFDNPVSRGYLNGQTPQEVDAIDTRQTVDRFTGAVDTDWRPLPWLTATGVVGIDFYSRNDSETVPPNQILALNLEGSRISSPYRFYNYTANVGLRANWTLRDGLAATSSAGVQYAQETVRGTNASGSGLLAGTSSLSGTGNRFSVSELNTDNKTLGAYLQQGLAWRDRLFVTGAIRADDNSAFGQDFGFIHYPAVSLSWVASEEPFFPRTSVINSLRLRGAYGVSGQRPNFRDAITYFNAATVRVSGVDVPGITIGGTGNTDLKPERSSEVEVGFEASLLDNRVGLALTRYDKTTNDALVAQPIPPSVGGSDTRFVNLGKVTNAGWELELTLHALRSARVGFDLSITGSTNHNELLDLGHDPQGNPIPPISLVFTPQLHREGYPLGGYWARPIQSYADQNGDGILSRAEVVVGDTAEYLGSPLPTRQLSIAPTLQLFGWLKIGALIDYKGGHKLSNLTRRFRCVFGNCREASDPSAALSDQAANIAGLLGSEAGYVTDASFTKLRELAFTLSAPRRLADRLGLEAVSLTIAGRNLKTWTNYTGFDPEANFATFANFNQADLFTQPPTRTWMARMDITW